MEKRRFRTLIKADHKFGGNAYIEGRIIGMAYVLCEVYKTTPHGTQRCDEGFKFLVECTDEQYERFVAMAEDNYPGLCIFDYKESK